MAAIVYLDADDEITSAASRIRAAADARVGARAARSAPASRRRGSTSGCSRARRIGHGRRLDIVAPDASARALAASAGLPVFASVGEYEDGARRRGRRGGRAPGGLARGGGRAARPARPRPADRLGRRPPGEPRGAAGSAAGVTAARRAASGARARRRADDRRPAPPRPAGRRRSPAPPTVSDTDLEDAPGAVGASTARMPRRAARRRAPAGRRRRDRSARCSSSSSCSAPSASAAYAPARRRRSRSRRGSRPSGRSRSPSRADPDGDRRRRGRRRHPGDDARRSRSSRRPSSRRPARRSCETRRRAPSGGRTATRRRAYRIPSGTVVKTRERDRVRDRRGGVPAGGDPVAARPPTPRLPVERGRGHGRKSGPGWQRRRRARSASSRRATTATSSGSRTPPPTTGGTREEFPRVKQKDVDAAMAKLNADAQDQFASRARSTRATCPRARRVPRDRASLGELDAVGRPADRSWARRSTRSRSALTAHGTVHGRGRVAGRGHRASSASQAVGRRGLTSSCRARSSVDVGDGTVVDGVDRVPGDRDRRTRSARSTPPRSSGSSSGSRSTRPRRCSQPYGDVVIDLWPGWVTTVPTIEQRVILTVGQPVGEAASPGSLARPVRRAGVELARRFPTGTTASALRRRLRGAAAYRPPREPHPRDRPRRAADRAGRRRTRDRRRPAAGDDQPRRDRRRRRRGARARLPRAGRHGARRRAADRGGGRRGHRWPRAPGRGPRRSARALALPVTMRDERLSLVRGRAAPRAHAARAGRAARRRGPSATPTARASIARPPPSSSRTSWTPAGRRGEHPQRSRSEAADRPRSPRPRSDARNPYQRHGPATAAGPGDQRRYERYGGPARRRRRDPALPPVPRASSRPSCSWSWPPSPGRSLRAVVVPWAWDNPAALQLAVRRGPRPRGPRRGPDRPRLERPTPRSSSSSQPGDTPPSLAPRLEDAGIIASQRAFLYQARQDDLLPKLNAGRFSLAANLTPAGGRRGPRQQPDRRPGRSRSRSARACGSSR